ncbi:MAG: prephenate dehydrogenase/arogenate dehydrogenase family protein [Proteobacteria bacterium]|nr:prephenate dehydrogenase/arogenate dehydrogenase family protein [Pseudomonadota bacterium]
MIQRLCIIGVGLIGGSLARALRSVGAVGSVIGCGRGAVNLQSAVRLGVIDEYSFDPATAVAGADMVVVATSLGASPVIFDNIAAKLMDDAVITDVGSAKRRILDAAKISFGDGVARFVPGHPIAGTEKSGVEASFADLFRDRQVILTPDSTTDVEALDKVTQMWRATGAIVSQMDVEQHDNVLAATSHLPHMLAYALVDCLSSMNSSADIFKFAAGGFRDLTRIASSSPEMWCDIAIDNRDALLTALTSFSATYDDLVRALAAGDKDSLLKLFARAKSARDAFGGTVN